MKKYIEGSEDKEKRRNTYRCVAEIEQFFVNLLHRYETKEKNIGKLDDI